MARAIVGAELAHGVDPGERPGRSLFRALRQPARLREPPEMLQAADLPHRLGVGARLEEIDLHTRQRRIVSNRGRHRVAVVVDERKLRVDS